uniref:Uncharacterized protein n=1 Tax=Acrobeloides nanus TaxID=290746 RepID=A0A914BVE4_9BILA
MLCIYLTKSSSHTGHICALFSFAFIITCQTFMNEIDFTGFRGPLMIGVMKQTSLAFDITNANFDFTETMAYLANPSTILFGPFTSIEKFRSIGVFPTNIKVQRT